MTATRDAVRQCLASNAAWRREAAALRDHAALPHLSAEARQTLLREAEAADRQADWWFNGAIEAS
jgi:phytoene/squalene synthetase